MRYLLVFVCFVLFACSSTKRTATTSQGSFQSYIDSVTKQYAPDKRTVLFAVEQKGNVVKGETISAEAKTALINHLNKAGLNYIDSIVVLPNADLQNKTKGVVTISVANLRTQPAHKAELATQATLGTPVTIWKRERGWSLVQTPDKYLAWVDGDAIERMDDAQFIKWQQQPKIIYTQPYGFAYEKASASAATVSDLVYGNVLELTGTMGDHYETKLPDGRKAYIWKEHSMPLEEWKKSRQPSTDNFIQTAKQLMGLPYLWGGTSFKGVDCSGFTKTVYFMNGLVLPRDASQQIMIGEEIDTKNGWQNLQPGDLLFFGRKAEGDRPESVVHVGMWIGNNQFIHASGKVRVSSFDANAPNYDASELRRFLRAKRISPQTSLIDLRNTGLFGQ